MMTLRRAPRILLYILALAAGVSAQGCAAGESVPAGEVAIARVGDRPVLSREFDAYLQSTLGAAEEIASAAPVVKSRLLDQFLDEEVLVQAALRDGLEVSDEELNAFLPENAGDRQRARRILLEKKYKEEVILKGITVSDEEIRGYFQSNLERFRRPARVVLRKILLDRAHEARNVHADLVRRPGKFEEIAETHSLSPDGGKPQAYELDSLPETIRSVVDRLKEGQISPVVEDPQGFFILRLDGRQPERSEKLEEVRDQIELKLLREKGQIQYRESVQALREHTRVVILIDKLGFPYRRRTTS